MYLNICPVVPPVQLNKYTFIPGELIYGPMLYLTIIVIILLATVIMVGVGDRLNLPWPVMMTLLGVGALLLPNRPHVEIESEIILPIFLPPLLWAIGVKFSWGTLKRRWRSVLLYSILLTTASALAVAGSAMWWVPGMTVAMALAIGAAIAPPDPVAVEAVAEPVGIPRRLIGTLQTEGSFNDAISLVLFHAAIHSLETHHQVEPLQVVWDFTFGAVVAVGIGYAFGWLGGYVRQRAHGTVARSAVTLVIPFGVYLVAETVHASGVIAVVIAAVQFTSTKYLVALEAEDRLSYASFWQVIELLLTGLAFGLIGLQTSEIIYRTDPTQLMKLFIYGTLISLVAISLRFLWFTAIWLAGRARKRTIHEGAPRTLAEVIIMTWSGMRGLVTLILALSIPTVAGTEQLRADSIVVVISVLFFTMVLPGLTLPSLVRLLRIKADPNEENAVPELLGLAQHAALGVLQEEARSASPKVYQQVKDMCTAITRRDDIIENLPAEYKPKMEAIKDSRQEYMRLRDAALIAAQHEVLAAQDRYDPDVVYRVIRKLDILSQAENIRSNNNFVLPALPAGAVAVERYRLLREHLGTASIPVVSDAPSMPLVVKVDTGEEN